MKQEKIKMLISDMMKTIIAHSEQVGKEFDKETIHDFRKEVKNLRSFLRLLRMYSNDHRLRMTKKFKRLYQIAGGIRDMQLELEQFKGNLVSLPEYIHQLEQLLAKRRKEWHRHYDKKTVQKLADKLDLIDHKPFHPAVLENFLSNKMASISDISHKAEPTDAQVHLIRKEVKDMLNTTRLAQKKWKGSTKGLKVLSVKKLSKIATVIGNYHDQQVTLDHISSFSSPNMEMDELNIIKTICSKEKNNLEQEKKNIITFVKNIVPGRQDSAW